MIRLEVLRGCGGATTKSSLLLLVSRGTRLKT
jgi:hypothetical protein